MNDPKTWKLLAMHDPSFRRGVWYRESRNTIEFCAGREGDDAYAIVQRGERLDLDALVNVLEYGVANTEAVRAEMVTRRASDYCHKTHGCEYARDHFDECFSLIASNECAVFIEQGESGLPARCRQSLPCALHLLTPMPVIT